MASLGELFVELGVFADTEELKKFEKELEAVNEKMKEAGKTADKTTTKIDSEAKATDKAAKSTNDSAKAFNKANATAINYIKGIGAIIGAVTAAAVAINKLTSDLVASNQAMLNLTRTSDISLGTFQKWDSIGKMYGIQNAGQQLESLNQRLFELQLTGQGARGFQLAGIDPRGMDAAGVLEQLRGRVAGLSDTSASYLLQQMGLDPQMLHILRMGRQEFEELGETMRKYQLTAEQRQQIQTMNVQLQIASQKLQYLKDRVILKIMPLWVELVKSFARVAEMLAKVSNNVGKFVIKWRGLIAGLAIGASKFIKLEGVIKRLLLPFRNMQAVLLKTLRLIPQIGPGLARAAAGFLRFGAVINKALLPLTAAFLILDDIAAFMNGGNSIIGDIKNWAENGEGKDIFAKLFSGDLGLFGEGLVELFESIGNAILEVLLKMLGIEEWFYQNTPWGKGKKSKELLEEGRGVADYKKRNILIDTSQFKAPKSERQAKAQELARMLEKQQNYTQHVPSSQYAVENMIMRPDIQRFLGAQVSNKTSNMTINQTNNIATNQPAQDIQNRLRFANTQYAFV